MRKKHALMNPLRTLAGPVVLTLTLASCGDPMEGAACGSLAPLGPAGAVGSRYYTTNQRGSDLPGGYPPVVDLAETCRFVDAPKTVLDCGPVRAPPIRPAGDIGAHVTLRFARSPVTAPPGTVLRAGRDFTVDALTLYTPADRENSAFIVFARDAAPITGPLVFTVVRAPAAGHDVPTMRGRGQLCGPRLSYAFEVDFRDARAPPMPF